MRGFTVLVLIGVVGCSGADDSAQPSGPSPFPLGATLHSHGDPSPREQEALELLQRARANPAAEGKLMVDEPSAQLAFEQYSIDKGQLVLDFEGYPSTPPLAFDSRIIQAARGHATDMATNGFQGHVSTDGSELGDRFDKVGYEGGAGENVFSYADSPVHAHASFLIDWGVDSLGHRMNALDLKGYGYRDAGIAVVEAAHPDVGPLVVVHDFGYPADELNPDYDPFDETTWYLPHDVFLVGVVFRDADGDGAYDAGEGVAGQHIVPELGDTYAITSASGGYAIPFPPDFGPVEIQWQNESRKVERAVDVSVTAQNQKLDFVLPN